MTGPTTPAVWTFVLDEDEDWVASREPAGEENLRRAVETLLYGIASAKAAQVYLAAWRADTQRWGTGFSLSTASAVAERVSAGTVRLIVRPVHGLRDRGGGVRCAAAGLRDDRGGLREPGRHRRRAPCPGPG
ncbi:hypothetical protein ABWK57_35805 [Streptomyces sp. NPDC094045]|uniref:hypothetical protein n=1 Tax=Streptomyces sp. NPDC094045 TaxID=3161019 RepID=UPI00339715F5